MSFPAHASNPKVYTEVQALTATREREQSSSLLLLPTGFGVPSAAKGRWGEGGRVKRVESVWSD